MAQHVRLSEADVDVTSCIRRIHSYRGIPLPPLRNAYSPSDDIATPNSHITGLDGTVFFFTVGVAARQLSGGPHILVPVDDLAQCRLLSIIKVKATSTIDLTVFQLSENLESPEAIDKPRAPSWRQMMSPTSSPANASVRASRAACSSSETSPEDYLDFSQDIDGKCDDLFQPRRQPLVANIEWSRLCILNEDSVNPLVLRTQLFLRADRTSKSPRFPEANLTTRCCWGKGILDVFQASALPNRDDCIVVLVIVARPLVAGQIDATEDPFGSFEATFAEVEVEDTFNRLPEKFSLRENMPTALL
ncbi:hypothetical protein Q7P36_008948 [Cladosporium allicinum]